MLSDYYEGQFSYLRLITPDDYHDLYNIRKFKKNNHLNPIPDDAELQKAYIKKSLALYKKGESGYYFFSSKNNPEQKGFVRITEIKNPTNFNWESLIVSDGTCPNVIIDIIIICYQIGMQLLNKQSCGPFPVPIAAKRINQLHLKMGFAKFLHEQDNLNWYVIDRKSFDKKITLYQQLGYGLKNFEEYYQSIKTD